MGKYIVYIDQDYQDLIPDYLKKGWEDIDFLKQALNGNDFLAIGKRAHDLAGSGGTYGFDVLSRIGRDLEVAAAQRDIVALDRLRDELVDYLDNLEVRFVHDTSLE